MCVNNYTRAQDRKKTRHRCTLNFMSKYLIARDITVGKYKELTGENQTHICTHVTRISKTGKKRDTDVH